MGEDWLLIDCPHPVRKMWREGSLAALGSALDLDRVAGVAISHLHADHASGLEDFAFYQHFALGRRSTWLADPSVSDRLWEGLLAAGMGRMRTGDDFVTQRLEDYVDLIPLSTASPVEFRPFSIEGRPTRHSIPTTAFRITAAGRTFGFSADSAYDPGLIDWLAPADLIVHEATSLPDSPVHTPYRHLAALPGPLRAKMRLTHLPDDFDAGPGAIEALRQGVRYAV